MNKNPLIQLERERNGDGEKANPKTKRNQRQNPEAAQDGRRVQSVVKIRDNGSEINPGLLFDKSNWLTTKEVAIYLRKIRADGSPSFGAIYMMLERGQLRKRKFFGRLYFDRREIDRALESANSF